MLQVARRRDTIATEGFILLTKFAGHILFPVAGKGTPAVTQRAKLRKGNFLRVLTSQRNSKPHIVAPPCS